MLQQLTWFPGPDPSWQPTDDLMGETAYFWLLVAFSILFPWRQICRNHLKATILKGRMLKSLPCLHWCDICFHQNQDGNLKTSKLRMKSVISFHCWKPKSIFGHIRWPKYICYLWVWVVMCHWLGKTCVANFSFGLYLGSDYFIKEMLWKSAYSNFKKLNICFLENRQAF